MTSLANALEPSSRAAALDGPETAIPTSSSRSASPATKRDLGADHHQVDGAALGQRDQPVDVVGGDGDVLGPAGRAGVAGRAQQRRAARAPGQGLHQRVFATSATDHQYRH